MKNVFGITFYMYENFLFVLLNYSQQACNVLNSICDCKIQLF